MCLFGLSILPKAILVFFPRVGTFVRLIVMPNGYSWLRTDVRRTHSFDHWVVHTGRKTGEGSFREPDHLESQAIEAVLRPLFWAVKFPLAMYDGVRRGSLREQGLFIWDHNDGEPGHYRAGISASAYEVCSDEMTWVDAVPLLVGCERDSSCVIALIKLKMQAVSRKVYSVEAKLCLREIVDTVVTVPAVRDWSGVVSLGNLESTERLVKEVIDCTLCEEHAYPGIESHSFWSTLLDARRLREDDAYREESLGNNAM